MKELKGVKKIMKKSVHVRVRQLQSPSVSFTFMVFTPFTPFMKEFPWF
jgi:hypothetical protein